MDDKIDSIRRAIALARLEAYPIYPVKAELIDGMMVLFDEAGNECYIMHPNDWEGIDMKLPVYVWDSTDVN